MEIIKELFGLEAERLDAYQMAARTIIVFFMALIFVRVAGIRTFGKKSSFDQVTTLILGTLMGNAIFAAKAPFFPLLLASLIFMLLHRLVAWITYRSHKLGNIIKGEPYLLVKEGTLQQNNLKKLFITKEDIEESLRLTGNKPTISNIKISYLERSGNISFVKNND
jgi:uncharacterized membrane protein YcaP (DUF421 family)